MANPLADLFVAAVRGNNPAPMVYDNDQPKQMPGWLVPQPPQAWLPPGFDQGQLPAPPRGPDPSWYDPQAHPVPQFHRLNPAPRNNWRDIQT